MCDNPLPSPLCWAVDLASNIGQSNLVVVNVGAEFPDDYEDSPLKPEILQKQNPNPGIEESYHPVSNLQPSSIH